MADRLHLLRPFTGWHWRMGPDKGKPIDTVQDAVKWVNMVRSAGIDAFSTTTARRPKRMIELPVDCRGSVYFVQRKHTVFRMPISWIDTEPEGEFDIIMRPTIHRCEARHVGMVRGWRYLEDKDAPPDRPADTGTLPDWYLEGA